jgi:hypothetical protein
MKNTSDAYLVVLDGVQRLLVMPRAGLKPSVEYIDLESVFNNGTTPDLQEINLVDIVSWAVERGYLEDLVDRAVTG